MLDHSVDPEASKIDVERFESFSIRMDFPAEIINAGDYDGASTLRYHFTLYHTDMSSPVQALNKRSGCLTNEIESATMM